MRSVRTAVISTSCPRCGLEAAPQASRCQGCGFGFFEGGEPRRAVRPSRRASASVALAAAVVVGAVLLFGRGEPRRAPRPPEPVAAARAEHRLERHIANVGYDDNAAVRCRSPISRGGATRCHVRYSDGDTQLILVGLDARGGFDVSVPYPAQRRPRY